MTSMKTIIARFTELKENVAGTEESEFQDLDLNRVDKALKSVGVQLKDTTGQFRDLDDVFMELSSIWQDLDRNTQRYVATIAAGSRQQSRFLALMDGYERNVELMQIAADSTGQADKQFAKYADSMEFRLNKLATKWEQLRQNILGQETFKSLLDQGSGLLDKIIDLNLTPSKIAVIVPFAAMMARAFIKTFAENISSAGSQFQTAFNNIGRYVSNRWATITGQTGNYSFAQHDIQRKTQKSAESGEIAQNQRLIQQKNTEIKQEESLLAIQRKREQVAKEQWQHLARQQRFTTDRRSEVALQLASDKQHLRHIESRLATERQELQLYPKQKTTINEITRLEAEREQILARIRGQEFDLQATEIVQLEYQQESAAALKKMTGATEERLATEQRVNEAIRERNQLQNQQFNIKASPFAVFMDKAGGIPGLFRGISTAGQQVSSTFGMMATMIFSGAKATDVLNTSLVMLGTQAIPQIMNLFPAIIRYITATKLLTNQQKVELVGLKAARDANTISQQQTIVLNKLEAASAEEAAAAEALLTGGLTLLIAALVAGGIAFAKYTINQEEKVKQDAYAASAAGKYAKAMDQLNESMQEAQKNYDEAKKDFESHQENYKLLTETYEKYANRIALTEEEAQDFLSAQQQIAEIAPELIAGYDEQGNKILAMADAWQSVIEKEKQAMSIAAAEKAKESVIAISQGMTDKVMQVKVKKSYQEIAKIFQESFKDNREIFNKDVLKAESTGIDAGLLYTGSQTLGVAEYEGNFYLDLQQLLKEGLSGEQKYSYAQILYTMSQLTNKKQAADIGELLKEELTSGKYGTSQFTSEATGINYLEELAKYLTEGTGQANQETANKVGKIFQDLITYGYDTELKNAKLEVERQKEEFNQGMEEIASGYAYRSDIFLNASTDQQSMMSKFLADTYALDYDTLYKAFKAENPDADESQFYGYVEQYIKDQFTDVDFEKVFKNAGFDKTSFEILTDIQKKFSEDLLAQAKELKEDVDAGNITQAFYDSWISAHESAFTSRKNDVEKLGKAMGASLLTDEQGNIIGLAQQSGGAPSEAHLKADQDAADFYGELGQEGGAKFAQNYAKAVENNGEKGKQAAKTYATNIKEAIEDVLGTGENTQGARDYAAAYDFSQVSELNLQNRRATFAAELHSTYGTATNEALALFDTLREETKKAALYTEQELEQSMVLGATEDVSKVVEQLGNHQKTLEKYSHKGGTTANVTTKEWEEIEDVIKDLTNPSKGGLDSALFSGLLHRDENGNAVFEYSKFFDVLGNNIDDVISKMLSIEGLTEEEENAILHLRDAAKLYRGEWMTIEDLISRTSSLVSSFSSAASEQIKNGYVSSKSIQSLLEATSNIGLDSGKMVSFFDEKMHFDFTAAYAYIDSEIKTLEATNNLTKADKEQLVVWQALKKELYIANLELQNEAKNTDEVADAWKDYNKQLDTVKEKQEALNDKIEAYNKLLYGDDLRKSGLDLLYNYNEAISTFNDEMSRAQDILSDAKNMEDATAAFEQYAAATHSLIVEEKAKQEQLQRGLNEYARMIEHGYASYTDTQTGRTIGINFGDYAKFDQNTGKYIINQTLLNRAKFNDDYKDLIEEYVETYNKYADEYKKSQDEVLKAEKQFQKLRKEALKNYADFEKSIADELKNQYEEEVDNLKEKYDAMKEEDDDYIKALQEAIDKQRKLRDKESKFEDLAKKEKKLSLISRDTSGTNKLQELQLEEEIQKSRQDLLDEQVDNIIDGMQKLYESQEETRNVEIELKEAIIDNTALINSQAEELGRGFTDADSYIEFMTQSKEFTELTYVQQLEKIEEYRETYAAAAQYMAMQNIDAASKSGDFIKDIIETTGEEIAWVVSNTSSTFVDEASRAYQAVSREVSESLDNAVKDIQNARDALKEAIEKLDEYARKAQLLQEKLNYMAEQGLNGDNPGADYVPDKVYDNHPTGGDNGITASPEIIEMNKLASLLGFSGNFTELGQLSAAIIRNKDSVMTRMGIHLPDTVEAFKLLGLNDVDADVYSRWKEGGFKKLLELTNVKKFESGGLVDFTGPAWVDGTKTAPEAFLNPEDTRRIGEAARILSNLPFFNSYGEANETITNNNGNVSIEINLNVDKLSSEIDVNEMLNRVKEEIVSVARPAGINAILTQQ